MSTRTGTPRTGHQPYTIRRSHPPRVIEAQITPPVALSQWCCDGGCPGADRAGRAGADASVGGDAVNAYLDGTRLPGWDFVADFLNVITGDERWHRELLERRVRPVWEAASA